MLNSSGLKDPEEKGLAAGEGWGGQGQGEWGALEHPAGTNR